LEIGSVPDLGQKAGEAPTPLDLLERAVYYFLGVLKNTLVPKERMHFKSEC
jgi:hypothetical protein